MCGIWAWLRSAQGPIVQNHEQLWEQGVKHLAARGPEAFRFLDIVGGTFGFTRLAINGLNEAGMQPFQDISGNLWMCNGEIYNAHSLNIAMPSGSDCEVIGDLWKRCNGDAVAFARALDGVFALALYDSARMQYVVARDPYGVRPLYYMYGDGELWFASERKALEGSSTKPYHRIEEFPPGQVWVIDAHTLNPVKYTYHRVPWIQMASTNGWQTKLREALEEAVKKRMLLERPVAALLSGGLDSSLIAALVQKELRLQGKPPLKTFSIGMPGATDLKYARMVADWIGSDHTEILTTADEMFSVIPEVIRDIESYDITTVRASVGNWMVAREIAKRTDCKVVFNGDGSDEVLGGYLYLYRAPTEEAFDRDCERLLEEISKYDVLRSDRSISSHGLEPRTPFLDKQFVAVARSLPVALRRPTPNQCEKWSLRTAFSDTGLLPNEVLWRKKEAFSDGVSSEQKSWYEEIQERIVQQGLVGEGWEAEAGRFVNPKPHTMEAYYYRRLYDEIYPHTGERWPFWMPKWSKTADPSARTLGTA